MIVRSAVWPAANVRGAVYPETLIPVPDHATLEIVALWLPVLASCRVWVVWLPTATVPKEMEGGEAVSAPATVPVPLRGTCIGEPGALQVILINPFSGLPTVGVKPAEMGALWPGLRARGNFGPEAVKPVPATEIPKTVSICVPLLVSVTVCVALWPTARFPKLTELGVTSNETPVTLGGALPVVPTQPDVIKSASRATPTIKVRMLDARANRCERARSFTRAPSAISARVISTRIVRWG